MANTSITIRDTIKYSGVYAAEKQMRIIAHTAGDEQLSLMVSELEPAEVSLLASEGDYTKPSMVSHFISADQFIGALERLGASWGQIGNSTDTIFDLKTRVGDFVLSVVLHAQGARQIELIHALSKSALTEEVLVILALHEPGNLEFLQDFDTRMSEKGTWQELYSVIRDTDEKLAGHLQKTVLEIEKQDLLNDKAVIKYLKRVLNALAHRAAKHSNAHNTATKSGVKTPQVFVDI